ncbi:hypothetical protein [Ruegeria sp. ANG-R]|nr:hypothetical protein [Ruegeria sp. ANG-R]
MSAKHTVKRLRSLNDLDFAALQEKELTEDGQIERVGQPNI